MQGRIAIIAALVCAWVWVAAAAAQDGAEAAATTPTESLDAFMEEVGLSGDSQRQRASDEAPSVAQAGKLRLIDVSLDVLLAAGGSTEKGETLLDLQSGGHDPRRRGFNVQNVELSLLGAVDPYFAGEAHLIYFIDPVEGESIFELEEAFVTTTNLPFGMQVEAGHFFTEFGRLNPRHPHAWQWLDQPVVNARLFGPDGLRGPGARLGWLTPLPWYSEFHAGIQNANGETMASFFASEELLEERAVVDRPFIAQDVSALNDFLYLGRWANGGDVSESVSGLLGLSVLQGPNYSGNRVLTRIYGADLTAKWRPAGNFRGWPFVAWESEIMRRDFRAAALTAEFDEGVVVRYPARTFSDWGLYSQLLFGFAYRWATGLRYDLGDASEAVPDDNQWRNRRVRVSPLVMWLPSEFSRLRLQYNYDRAPHLENGPAHSLWLGIEWSYGAHPAHAF